jgi:uncharacterized DUF497 family protein
VDFEFDPNKSKENEEKHGINFEDAKELWAETKFVEAPAEARFFRIAMIDGVLWFCIFTMRRNKVRLISVRRTRPEEEDLYYEQQS